MPHRNVGPFFPVLSVLLFLATSSSAQEQRTIKPSGKDPVSVACPNGPTSGDGIDPYDAWNKGTAIMHTETGRYWEENVFDHAREALDWFCKASAAGHAVAPYDIGVILAQGYRVTTRQPNGKTLRENYLSDRAAMYWYELAAERGFTKGMLAFARVYSASKVPAEREKALNWLNKAAEDGDSEALMILATRYQGLAPMAPWYIDLPFPKDTGKGAAYQNMVNSKRDEYRAYCADPERVAEMVRLLPSVSEGRPVIGTDISEVHGMSNPIEIDCFLLLGAPGEKKVEPDRGFYYGMYEALNKTLPDMFKGSTVRLWKYSIVKTPGHPDSIIRQLGAEALAYQAELVVILEQLLTMQQPQRPR